MCVYKWLSGRLYHLSCSNARTPDFAGQTSQVWYLREASELTEMLNIRMPCAIKCAKLVPCTSTTSSGPLDRSEPV